MFIYINIFLFLHHVSCTLYRPGVIFSLRIVSTCREIWLVWCHFLRIFEPLKILKVIFGVNYLFICTLIYILCSLINLRIVDVFNQLIQFILLVVPPRVVMHFGLWRALKRLELLSAASRSILRLFSCSPNFLRKSYNSTVHGKA